MARSSSYTYNPKTGDWKMTPTNSDTKSSSNSSKSNTAPSTDVVNNAENLLSSTPDSLDSAGEVEKIYNNIEINTLSGSLTFISTQETIKLRAGDTVNLEGLGKHLSGNYYVQDVTRQISSNGYSHNATLIRTNFGSSLKVTTDVSQKTYSTKEAGAGSSSGGDVESNSGSSGGVGKSVSSSASAKDAGRTYTVKKGDSLWKIAKQFYGNGSKYTKIYDANTKKIANPNLIYVGQVFLIP